VLPDLNEGRWQYNFTGPVPDGMHKGVEAYAYSYSVVTDEGNGETTATYTFYIGTVHFVSSLLVDWVGGRGGGKSLWHEQYKAVFCYNEDMEVRNFCLPPLNKSVMVCAMV